MQKGIHLPRVGKAGFVEHIEPQAPIGWLIPSDKELLERSRGDARLRKRPGGAPRGGGALDLVALALRCVAHRRQGGGSSVYGGEFHCLHLVVTSEDPIDGSALIF